MHLEAVAISGEAFKGGSMTSGGPPDVLEDVADMPSVYVEAVPRRQLVNKQNRGSHPAESRGTSSLRPHTRFRDMLLESLTCHARRAECC